MELTSSPDKDSILSAIIDFRRNIEDILLEKLLKPENMGQQPGAVDRRSAALPGGDGPLAIEKPSTLALAEFDNEVRFRALSKTGDPSRGLELLDKLDSHF